MGSIPVMNETGMRWVEVRNRQIKWIDLLAGEVHLQKSKTRGGAQYIVERWRDGVRAPALVRARKLGVDQCATSAPGAAMALDETTFFRE